LSLVQVAALVVYAASIWLGLRGVARDTDEDSWSTWTSVLLLLSTGTGIWLSTRGRAVEVSLVALVVAALLVVISWTPPDGWGHLWFVNVAFVALIQVAVVMGSGALTERLARRPRRP
jgi:hypothetical protein